MKPAIRPITAAVAAVALLFAGVPASSTPTRAAERPADHVAFFIANYGLADPAAHPLVARAYRVFDRVRAAADVAGRRSPRLKVIASLTDPWAQALRDGYVLLSRGAVAICYRAGDPALGDARLAFVLGHELAHLAKDDFWHAEVHWAWLRAHAAALPAPFRRQVCERTTAEERCAEASPPVPALPWELPAAPGTDLYEAPAVRARLESPSWKSQEFDFQRTGMHGAISWQPGRAAVLVLDGYVDTVALYGPRLGTAEELTARVGPPRAVQALAGGELWTYGGDWTVRVQEGQVTEVWVVSRKQTL
jgi:hypothetical protein